VSRLIQVLVFSFEEDLNHNDKVELEDLTLLAEKLA